MMLGKKKSGDADSKEKVRKKGRGRVVLIVVLVLIVIGAISTYSSNTDEDSEVATSTDSSNTDGDSKPSFSKKEAMRALTVACSNGIWSIDAYADEDDDIDESTAPIGVYGALIEDEMHPYDETQSGRYLYGSSYDDCYAVDSDTWHIEGLTLDSYENYVLTNYQFEVSGDVSFDGEYYWVSNVTMEYKYWTYDEDGNIDIWGGTQEGTWCENEFSDEPFKVSPSLIEDED